ncbi:hypothetical protein E2C01_083861 [Portunus trituberculatus]|uniref:Uncharacterized protein n=1 Tax=Portunus trituberculatus TaxID=210409 RepID=A0A5B7J4R8_PORTR|nr:hypothetical protein [Portunus trituberculatus]
MMVSVCVCVCGQRSPVPGGRRQPGSQQLPPSGASTTPPPSTPTPSPPPYQPFISRTRGAGGGVASQGP